MKTVTLKFDELMYDERSKCSHLLKNEDFVVTINTKEKTAIVDSDFLE